MQRKDAAATAKDRLILYQLLCKRTKSSFAMSSSAIADANAEHATESRAESSLPSLGGERPWAQISHIVNHRTRPHSRAKADALLPAGPAIWSHSCRG